jgi:hypothetical protein
MNVLAITPESVQVSCGSAPVDIVERTASATSSRLNYNATTDRYTYVWKTEPGWAGTCRVLSLAFADGTYREVAFLFHE